MSKQSEPKILIVEDDKLLSFVEERLVEKVGYKVSGKVTSGEEAIRYAREQDPDLIIMDIKLDGSVTGVDAMEQIREFSSVPVIFLSGSNTKEADSRINKMENCIDYLIKPVNADDLRKPLQKVFEEGSDAGKESKNKTDHSLAS